jgi:hypothetical protein
MFPFSFIRISHSKFFFFWEKFFQNYTNLISNKKKYIFKKKIIHFNMIFFPENIKIIFIFYKTFILECSRKENN